MKIVFFSSLEQFLGIEYIVFTWGIDWILVERMCKPSNGFRFAILIFNYVSFLMDFGRFSLEV